VALGPWTSLWGQGAVSDEELVRSRDDQERTAALGRDVAALELLWSDEFTVNAPNNTVSIGKRAAIDAFVRAGVINFSSFERQIEFIRVDGDFAFIMGLETVVPVSDAPAFGLFAGQPVQRRFTNIWKKEGDTWRLFARHANVIPKR
jgi:ketosteroid isomerase-like protein